MINRKVIIVVVLLLLGLVLLLKPATLHSTEPVSPVPLSEPAQEKVEEAPKATSTPEVSRETPVVKQAEGRDSYIGIVQEKARTYGVSASLMTAIIDCENRDWIADQQSRHTYKRDRPKQGLVAGQREQSFGLVQIHLPDHPTITYEQATNPTFSIEFLARELSLGRGKQWSCYSVAVQELAYAGDTRHSAE